MKASHPARMNFCIYCFLVLLRSGLLLRVDVDRRRRSLRLLVRDFPFSLVNLIFFIALLAILIDTDTLRASFSLSRRCRRLSAFVLFFRLTGMQITKAKGNDILERKGMYYCEIGKKMCTLVGVIKMRCA